MTASLNYITSYRLAWETHSMRFGLKTKTRGLERGLNGQEHLLLLPRTNVVTPAPEDLMLLAYAGTNTHRQIHTQIHTNTILKNLFKKSFID